MILFLRELKRNRKTFIIWTSLILLYNILVISFFPVLTESKAMNSLMKDMKGTLDFFGMGFMDFSNVLSLFGAYSFVYLSMMGGVYAMILGSGILSREEGEKTIEFLMSKPIKRSSIVSSKLAAIFFNIVLLSILYTGTSIIMMTLLAKQSFNYGALMSLMLAAFLIFILFAALGIFLSTFISKPKSIVSISIGIVLGTYIIGGLSAITKEADFLKYFSPFKYMDTKYIMDNGRINYAYGGVFLAVIAVCIGGAYYFYNKKDIKV